jgi:multiple sugar transport system substrate-binding protein
LTRSSHSAPREVVTWTQDDVYNAFISGRCAMMINGPWQLSRFETDKVEFRWEVASSPRGVRSASALGGENFAIGNGTHTDAAWDVLTWMAEPDHVRQALAASGFLPNRKDMVDDPAFSGRNVKVFVDQIEIARPRAYGPAYPQVSSVVSAMFQQVLTGQKTPQQAVREAAPEIDQLLDRP